MMTTAPADRRLSNYLRVHRKNTFLSQQEMADVLGYAHQAPISRHEHFIDVPSLEVAIGYEIVFRIPVSEIFAGMRDEVEMEIERHLEELETKLGERNARDRNAIATAKKLIWLNERKSSENESLS